MELYTNAYRLASEFLENKEIKDLWRNPKKLFQKMGWELVPYSIFDNQKLSTEAYSSYKYGRFFILYCENTYPARITFNFHHEAGHIVAAHPIIYGEELCKSCISSEKDCIEREATIIGRNIFLPANILRYIVNNSNVDVETIKLYFRETYNLSVEYTNIRFSYLETDYNNMVYPKWMGTEETKEYGKFCQWYLQNRYQPFIAKYVQKYKHTPKQFLGNKNISIPLKHFHFELTGQMDRSCYGPEYGSGTEYEYTGICENLTSFGNNLTNKIAVLKVYEYPEGEVNQVLLNFKDKEQ